jgi:transcriptional regulator with XRE-family HTH domain
MTMLEVPSPHDVYAAMSAWEALDDRERALRLRAALISAKMKQADLMRFLDVSQTIISKWANGRGTLSWPRWLAICQLADVPMAWVPPADVLHQAWEEWRDEAEKRDRDFKVPEPPTAKKRASRS